MFIEKSMMGPLTATAAAVAVTSAFAGSSFAGSALSTISTFVDPTNDGTSGATVFEDTTFNFVPSIGTGTALAVFNIQEIGFGNPGLTLADSNNTPGTFGPNAGQSIGTEAAGITVQGALTGVIDFGISTLTGDFGFGFGVQAITSLVELAQAADNDLGSINGNARLVGVEATVVTQDSFVNNIPVANNGAATQDLFTTGDSFFTFVLDGVDDFFQLGIENGSATSFEIGLSVLTNDSGFNVVESLAGGTVNPGATVDFFGSGVIGSDPGAVGATGFAPGDGNFSINLVPSPAAAGVGLMGGLGLLARRRKA